MPRAEGTAGAAPPAPAAYVVVVTIVTSGSVADYTDEVRGAIIAAFAKASGVDPVKVSLTITAASVRLAITIATPDQASAETAQSALSPLLASADAAAEAFLPTGFAVEAAPTLAIAYVAPGTALSPPPPAPLSDADAADGLGGGGGGGGAGGVAAAAGVAGLVLTVAVYALCRHRRRRRQRQQQQLQQGWTDIIRGDDGVGHAAAVATFSSSKFQRSLTGIDVSSVASTERSGCGGGAAAAPSSSPEPLPPPSQRQGWMKGYNARRSHRDLAEEAARSGGGAAAWGGDDGAGAGIGGRLRDPQARERLNAYRDGKTTARAVDTAGGETLSSSRSSGGYARLSTARSGLSESPGRITARARVADCTDRAASGATAHSPSSLILQRPTLEEADEADDHSVMELHLRSIGDGNDEGHGSSSHVKLSEGAPTCPEVHPDATTNSTLPPPELVGKFQADAADEKRRQQVRRVTVLDDMDDMDDVGERVHLALARRRSLPRATGPAPKGPPRLPAGATRTAQTSPSRPLPPPSSPPPPAAAALRAAAAAPPPSAAAAARFGDALVTMRAPERLQFRI